VRFVAVAVNIEIGEPPSSVLADHDTVVCCVSLLVLVTPLGSPGTVGASTAPAGAVITPAKRRAARSGALTRASLVPRERRMVRSCRMRAP
jgi:hypothetical protein